MGWKIIFSVFVVAHSGFFRSARFGANEAHGKANIIQLNWLREQSGVVLENGKYVYVPDKMPDDLANALKG